MELRPLGFGEIFDRAITLYIRNFLPFAGIVGVIIVPLAVLQYFVDQSSVPQWDQMMQVLAHPDQTPPPPVLPSFLTSPAALALFVLLIAVVWFLWPFALNACAVGVARLYRGRPVEFVPCYQASLRRWPAVVGLLLIEVALILAWYLAFVIVSALAIIVAVALARVAIVLGVLAGIFAGGVIIAGLLTIAPTVVALMFAMNSIVIEEQPVFSAIGLGFSRVFNRQEFWRSVLFAIAAGAVMIGASTLISVVVMVAMVAHLVALEVVLSSVFRAAVAPFSVVLLAIYYFDVRIRREGYEIEAGLDRLAGTPNAGVPTVA
ncbi:MAG: hypothetical protein JO241_11120 [Candidatus Eremiobacteraeota bacterium]|nr:hypothetical protein [Candidatus Eremiobacteraeota bacterium]MBV8284949.1 hypothetical protein [Candidatus Eremiobacteraeota bacterium]MBV8584538.1 hypothetical protein [Candidatus Eremiobacteraeota bacterium]